DLNTFVENTHVYYARRAAVEMSTAADKSAAAEQPARVIDTGIVYPVVEGTPHLGTRLGKLAMNFLGDQVRKRSGFIFRSIY
ncbi:MAG TPA: hypothetical protein VIJ25_07470, partial [Methylococcales bacterium]